ncbi:MAG TPA: cytochrome c peroxidase [Saprospiraceae bacterium]|nr:cytochrome c peroxidase [Saprospiraceae bacterium]HMQ85053.1 cytochrome c peroxidase [Saprospiraceae bacterium]
MKKLPQLSLLALCGGLLFFVACSDLTDGAEPIGAPGLPEIPYAYSTIQFPPDFQFIPNFGNGGAAIDFDDLILIDEFGNVDLGDEIFVNIDPNVSSGNSFEMSNITDAGATLGRVLFYDPQLSLNNAVACGSCHRQKAAFADGQIASEGFGGKFTPRNSMAIVNVALNNNLFWDSRIASLRLMVTQPVQNHLEMGMESMDVLATKLARVDYYPELFQAAFGTREVTGDRIANALTQFLSAMVTANSRFDQAQQNDFASFNELERMGKDLFFGGRAKCSSCHSGANFSAPDSPFGEYGAPTVKGTANIGLDLVYADNGKGEGQFKIPSLRNIALTAPYMHDGRFNTLEEVVEHYNSGIQAHRNLDEKLIGADGNPMRLGLNDMEKQALVAFLRTLTDEDFIRDQRFSDPFSR